MPIDISGTHPVFPVKSFGQMVQNLGFQGEKFDRLWDPKDFAELRSNELIK